MTTSQHHNVTISLERWHLEPEAQQFRDLATCLGLTIRELAAAVAVATGYQGEIHWDASQPDGGPKKQLDVSRLAASGWRARIPLAEGLASTVALCRQGLLEQLVRL